VTHNTSAGNSGGSFAVISQDHRPAGRGTIVVVTAKEGA
jgi:hypothetical protein